MRTTLALLLFVGGCGSGGGFVPRKDGGAGDMANPANCSNGMKDGDETDVDCGGGCGGCADGRGCVVGDDCLSMLCVNAKCAAPTCMDGFKNGNETDVDCGGGGACSGCADGRMCKVSGDCQSAFCDQGTCKKTPCSNGIRDGQETDVDCGGGTCGPCADGRNCSVGGDCQSGNCSLGKCAPQANCFDGKKNGNETDIDCGGGTCGTCADDLACIGNGDCDNFNCSNQLCCSPGRANCNGNAGDFCEVNLASDVKNCGSCGKACPNGQQCVNSMCVVQQQSIKVAFLGGGFYVDQPRAWLATQPMIASATRIDVCDVNTLSQYQVVVVHGNGTCFDGNNFSTYVQNGGGMVATPWVFANNGGFAALPLTRVTDLGAVHSVALSVNVTNANDVLLSGVNFANGNSIGYEKATYTLRNGATNAVIWNNDPQQLAVAKWTTGNGRAVYLNFQYLTSDTACALGGGNPNVGPYPWAQALLYNSVLWAGKLK